jgi:glycosyltransferase involved in cell wall biosynthesis
VLTVVILTKNEAARLPRCLDAIPAGYPKVVVDSGSDDETVAIARRRGCAVYSQGWLGFAEQRNFALNHCGIKEGWVLFIDADEVYPPDFYTWFEGGPDLLSRIDVLMVPSRLVFCGERLRYAPGYPIYHPRLVRSEISPFTMGHAGHSESLISGVRAGYGGIPYDHHFFDGDIDTWMRKHLGLARMEVSAVRRVGVLTSRARLSLLLGRCFIRAPIRFGYHYVIKRGFLDGWWGLLYSLMYGWYELTKYLIAQFQKRE